MVVYGENNCLFENSIEIKFSNDGGSVMYLPLPTSLPMMVDLDAFGNLPDVIAHVFDGETCDFSTAIRPLSLSQDYLFRTKLFGLLYDCRDIWLKSRVATTVLAGELVAIAVGHRHPIATTGGFEHIRYLFNDSATRRPTERYKMYHVAVVRKACCFHADSSSVRLIKRTRNFFLPKDTCLNVLTNVLWKEGKQLLAFWFLRKETV